MGSVIGVHAVSTKDHHHICCAMQRCALSICRPSQVGSSVKTAKCGIMQITPNSSLGL